MVKNSNSEDILAEELTLLLLYLASWTEKKGDAPRAWKNHRFEILDMLAEKDYLFGSKGLKSVYITAEGLTAAKKLKEKYGGSA